MLLPFQGLTVARRLAQQADGVDLYAKAIALCPAQFDRTAIAAVDRVLVQNSKLEINGAGFRR